MVILSKEPASFTIKRFLMIDLIGITEKSYISNSSLVSKCLRFARLRL